MGWSSPAVFRTVVLRDYSSVPELSDPSEYYDGLLELLSDCNAPAKYITEYAEAFRQSVIACKDNLPDDMDERQKLLSEYEALLAQAAGSKLNIECDDSRISSEEITATGALINIAAGKEGTLSLIKQENYKVHGWGAYKNACTFELTLSQDDMKLELDVPVIISMPIPDGVEEDNIKVFICSVDNRKAPQIIEFTVVDGSIVFEVEAPGIYSITNVISANQGNKPGNKPDVKPVGKTCDKNELKPVKNQGAMNNGISDKKPVRMQTSKRAVCY